MITLEQKQLAFAQLAAIKRDFAARGWFPATSGNLSLRVGEPDDASFVFAITASGKDKSISTPEDFLLINDQGIPVENTNLKPSAETSIHCELYRLTGCGAVFHVHTVFNNLVCDLFPDRDAIPVTDVELVKAFNIWQEGAHIEIPVLPNYADVSRISKLIKERLVARIPGIVLRRHGIYAWGANIFEARRHLEAFEFLFEYVYRLKSLGNSRS